jgi:hypothetical protein
VKRTHFRIVLPILLAIGLAACGREQAVPAAPAQTIDGKPKEDAKKVNPADNAPKVVDPLKEGY